MTQWSPQQQAALAAAFQWLSSLPKQRGRVKTSGWQVFRLFGFAGTGKTTLARHLAEGIDGTVCFAAYTGKAALVMRNRGCPEASTIHSLIYSVQDDGNGAPRFVLNKDSAAATAALIVVDECSMVDEELGKDLLSFGTPVLVLGDPAQLPPVQGGGFFTSSEPDIMLTEVHRQARDNPIIALSKIVREGGRLERGTYGDCRVVGRDGIDASDVLAAGQVLVGVNRTRRTYNARIRKLKGRAAPAVPEVGDTLVCLRNNHSKGLLNGGLWSVRDFGERRSRVRDNLFNMFLAPVDAGMADKNVEVMVPAEFFTGTENTIPWRERRKFDEFDFGYALTVHKAQGSQWDDVIVFDESAVFGEDRARHLYTAITRAAERLTVVKMEGR